jgi:hypothetical protein
MKGVSKVTTQGKAHRDAHEHYDVMGCEYQHTDPLLAALHSDWLSNGMPWGADCAATCSTL